MISIACNSILLQQLQTTSKIVYPILTAIGFTSLFTHLYEYRTHQRLYQTLILILKFFALELAMLSTVTAYYPELWISHYRIMSMLNSIGVFCYPILFMVTDLEMLKLLYVLTSFSVGFIVKVQIFELLLGIGLGGGVLCFPFTDLSANHICSKWYDLITILIGYASLVVVCQCIYISIKMFQYVTSAHASKERTVYIWYAIPTILIFFIVCVVGDVMAVVGFQIRTYKSECSIAGDIGIILVNGSTCLSTLLIFIYGFIFKFIKNMKFGEEHVVRHSKKASRNVAMTK
ncbi:hypothetical protein BC833DRAFT_597592 [Globomyces pollinis-pini]|nr:hypothetical protein BC833DRAFT_597592 [Globomyces pollinis-pini]